MSRFGPALLVLAVATTTTTPGPTTAAVGSTAAVPPTSRRGTAPTTPTTSRPSSPSTPSTQPPAPNGRLAGRAGHVAQWSGRELLAWGGGTINGDRVFGDGAAYDPARRAWRPLAPAPLSPRRDALSAWTGERLLVVGGAGSNFGEGFTDGALYDPGADRWERIAPAPAVPLWSYPVGVWLGRFLACGGFWPGSHDGRCEPWDPRTDSWRMTAEPPAELIQSNAAFYDPRVGAVLFPAKIPTSSTGAVLGVYGYRPDADRWEVLARSSFDMSAAVGIEVARVGDRYAFFSPYILGANHRYGTGVVFDPAATAFSPLEGHDTCRAPVTSVDDLVVVWAAGPRRPTTGTRRRATPARCSTRPPAAGGTRRRRRCRHERRRWSAPGSRCWSGVGPTRATARCTTRPPTDGGACLRRVGRCTSATSLGACPTRRWWPSRPRRRPPSPARAR